MQYSFQQIKTNARNFKTFLILKSFVLSLEIEYYWKFIYDFSSKCIASVAITVTLMKINMLMKTHYSEGSTVCKGCK